MSENLQHTVTIEDRVIELHPMRGRAARSMVPRLLTLASGFLFAASESGLDVKGILRAFTDPSVPAGDVFATFDIKQISLAVNLICRRLEKEYDEIEKEIFPFLLSVEPAWLEEHGDLFEVYEAVFVAIRYHLQTSFGKRVADALKKLAAGGEPDAGEKAAEPATD